MSYSIEEKVKNNKIGPFVSIEVVINREDSKGFNVNAAPWHRFEEKGQLRIGETIYIVSYIYHEGEDYKIDYFLDEDAAQKYIESLVNVIISTYKTDMVMLHNGGGSKSLVNLVTHFPVNSFISFKIGFPYTTHTISLAKTRIL